MGFREFLAEVVGFKDEFHEGFIGAHRFSVDRR